MLVVNNKAPCITCDNEPRVNQSDGTEATEKWVCLAYKKGIPLTIIVDGDKCKYYKKKSV